MIRDNAAIISVQAYYVRYFPSLSRPWNHQCLAKRFFGHPTQHPAVKRLDIHGDGSGSIVNGGLFYIWLRTLASSRCLPHLDYTSPLDIGCFIVCPPIGTLNGPIRSFMFTLWYDMLDLTSCMEHTYADYAQLIVVGGRTQTQSMVSPREAVAFWFFFPGYKVCLKWWHRWYIYIYIYIMPVGVQSKQGTNCRCVLVLKE